jgi:hypothetical protein
VKTYFSVLFIFLVGSTGCLDAALIGADNTDMATSPGGGDLVHASAPVAGVLNFDAFYDQEIGHLCEVAVPCCSSHGYDGYPNDADCKAKLSGELFFQLNGDLKPEVIRDLITNGLVVFNQSAAQDCLSRMSGYLTSYLSKCLDGISYFEVTGNPHCAAAFQGMQPDGAACTYNMTCASRVCDAGVCTPARKIGESCLPHPGDDVYQDYCVLGSSCSDFPGDKPGVTCQPYVLVGEACNHDADCSSQTCTAGVCAPDMEPPNLHMFLDTLCPTRF